MSGELMVSFSRTKPARIIRERTVFKITPTTISAWFTLHCPHIDAPTDAMINRAIYVFKTLLHRVNECDDVPLAIYRDVSVWNKSPSKNGIDIFLSLFLENNLKVCNTPINISERLIIKSERKLKDIILNDNDYALFESYWPKQSILADILATLMLISRRLLSGSRHWYEFPREIVEKIVCAT